jgi:chondroitin 4-sulfotransferase 11
MITENLVFIHPPRCGGTSIEKSFEWENESEKHLSAYSIKKKIGEKQWNKSFKFAVIRNPFDRVISMYHARCYRKFRKGIEFETLEKFLSFIPRIPTEEGIQCSDFINENMDFIIRHESRNKDLDKLYEEFGIKIDKNINIRQTNRYKDYKIYHNKNTIELVKLKFKDDIARFEYQF